MRVGDLHVPTVVDILPVHSVVPAENVPAEANWAKSKAKRSAWPWVALAVLVLAGRKRRRR